MNLLIKPDSELVLIEEKGTVFKAAWFLGGKQLRLLHVQEEPVLEINGVRMHQAKVKPSIDFRNRAKLAGVEARSCVLDVCTGLGYSALAALNAGAQKVVTIEIDSNVLKLARLVNKIQKYERIIVINKDAFKALQNLQSQQFDAVMLDPPRFSFAGELYSFKFYKEIFRVLKFGKRMFCYTGTPMKTTAFLKGVKNRLAQAGFKNLKWSNESQGFTCIKL